MTTFESLWQDRLSMRSVLVSVAMALLAMGGHAADSAATGVVTGRIVDVATGEPIPGATASLSPVQSSSGAGPPSGGAIEGRVLDGRGTPVVRVLVLAMQQLRNRDGTVRLTGGASGQTNDLGEFRVSGLAAGQYAVLAQPPASFVNPFTGGSPTAAAASYVRTFYPGSFDVAQASPVTVSRGLTTRGIEFSMLSVPSYQVFVVVVDNSGRPVGGAAVRLVQARPPLPATVYQGSPSALDGTFVVVNVPEGSYSAQAAIPIVTRNSNGGISASIRGERAGGPGSVEVVVRGANVQGLRLVATPP